TCGTDLKVFRRGYHARMIVPPAVFGHELAGVISEVRKPSKGGFVDGWRVGDRVVVANSAPCGKCFYCFNSQENLCDDLLFLNGAYAESIIVPSRIAAKNMLKLKPGINFKDAALTEPLACVIQGIEDCRLRAGQNVLIFGAGPIGLMFVAVAKHLGCTVTVAGRREVRLAAARKLGATRVIAVEEGVELVEQVKAATSARFDVVVEAVGKPEVWEAAVQLVRKGGVVNFFGGCPSGTGIHLDTTLLHYSNLTLLASFHHTPRSIRRALDLIERRVVHSADFVDGKATLEELPALFKSMAAGNQMVKTLVSVQA
ncbi:MAG TPA: zinc-binding dehydrogenase, partial [Candidatus Dormibacteraeota bacterium]|nr:zinc-binding dehydrogenase [Candidatus Dormibacteraeota bacterium]